ncbi:MAG: radical SAM protein [Candidatus Bathyarchaeota archaeon]|nr:radical SAM protein [Candidatus Bathyarchaeota archaeon]
MTDWCNYNCPYCFQSDHSRNHRIANGVAHCFDNASPQKWVDAIERNFRNKMLELHITGGEPMLDAENMSLFLQLISDKKFLRSIFITTNFAWNPKKYEKLQNKSKIYLMGSFHPSQISIDKFFEKTQQLSNLGWTISFVNYMMTPTQAPHYLAVKKRFSQIGIPLNPGPLVGAKLVDDYVDVMKADLGELDFYYKTGCSTKGKICLYPTLAYEMGPSGNVTGGCAPMHNGNIFKSDSLPQKPVLPIKCPYNSCLCLSKYSFIKGINRNVQLNTVKQYGNVLRERYNLPLIE